LTPSSDSGPFTGGNRVEHNMSMTETMDRAQEAPPAGNDEVLIFEQPLNERMRTFLRLDFLYSQALYHNEAPSPWGSRAAMSSLLDILAITTRGDTRSDVLKELERHLASLNEYQAKPGVDGSRLHTVMTNLVRLRTDLLGSGSACLQPLRESEFLNAIKHRSAIPGGTCEFDLPDYFFWLSQPSDLRMRAFDQWLGTLRPMCDAIAELLWLTRQSGRAREETAPGGVYHITFERDSPTQLLRISLPASLGLYPEVSGSHYRCSIRFLTWNGLESRATQTENDVRFMLSCCN
jgi:cell division protein ZapD